MALSSVDWLIEEVNARIGTRSELAGAAAGSTYPAAGTAAPQGRIEKAINDAFQEVVLTYQIPQFEADPPWYFKSMLYQTGTASASLDGVAVTGDSTVWATAANATIGWLFKFDDEETWHEIISIGSNTAMVVSPRFDSAHAAGSAYTIVQNHFAMPTAAGGQTAASPNDVYFILDVRDLEQNRRIEPADLKLPDAVWLATGAPTNYARFKNGIILWPAPDEANIYYRVRYIQRPQYRATGATPANTLSPLPEEWQEIVILLSCAKVLSAQMEIERAQALKELAHEQASKLMNVYAMESRDYRVQLRPSELWARTTDQGRAR